MDAVPLEWTSALEVGIADIDSQHRELFARVARVRDAAFSGATSEVARTIGFLVAYVGFHFEAEERLMRETEYPGLVEQVRQHADFNRRLRSLVPHWESEGGSTALLLALTGALDLWLRDHVTSCDQRFGDFLRDRGSSATVA